MAWCFQQHITTQLQPAANDPAEVDELGRYRPCTQAVGMRRRMVVRVVHRNGRWDRELPR